MLTVAFGYCQKFMFCSTKSSTIYLKTVHVSIYLCICLYMCLAYVWTCTWILAVSNLGSSLLKSMQNISNFSFISHSFRRLERESCHFLKKWINTRKNQNYWISWFLSVQQLLPYGENNMFRVGNSIILYIQEHIPSVSVTERCVAWRSFLRACKQSVYDRDKWKLVCFIEWWGFLDCIWLRAEYLLLGCLLPFSFFLKETVVRRVCFICQAGGFGHSCYHPLLSPSFSARDVILFSESWWNIFWEFMGLSPGLLLSGRTHAHFIISSNRFSFSMHIESA